MTEEFAGIKPIITPQQLAQAQVVATTGNHDLIAPTHLIVKGGETVGYLSIGNIPVFLGCICKGKVSPRDSFNLVHIAENLLQSSRCASMLMPLGQESPFHPLAEKMGFKKLSTVDLFVKQFTL